MYLCHLLQKIIFTGGGQKLHISTVVLPVADSILVNVFLPLFHLKMLSATRRTSLPVRSFCPPPVFSRDVTLYHATMKIKCHLWEILAQCDTQARDS